MSKRYDDIDKAERRQRRLLEQGVATGLVRHSDGTVSLLHDPAEIADSIGRASSSR